MINPEDSKLVTLATSTLARSGAQQAAALRDTTGRTYVAINVTSPSLNLDAFEAVLTVALASGISGIESVVATGSQPANVKAIKDFSPSATLFYIDASGEERAL
ncbi:MAG: cytidine deaminase [Actinobacteria bacterium]|jgi:hypothetical protein|uniref:Unannotated protein n=1 Tax=freshwater metagenome TaxID=449393 RepID=A0A6J7BE50_9ZZZZ|nr:cytidine deaminase [Actinomycetota bacterium]MSX60511.1 cytidine deaminase [Actinomycetota bacterium]